MGGYGDGRHHYRYRRRNNADDVYLRIFVYKDNFNRTNRGGAVTTKPRLGCDYQTEAGLWLPNRGWAVTTKPRLGGGYQTEAGLWLPNRGWAVITKIQICKERIFQFSTLRQILREHTAKTIVIIIFYLSFIYLLFIFYLSFPSNSFITEK